MEAVHPRRAMVEELPPGENVTVQVRCAAKPLSPLSNGQCEQSLALNPARDYHRAAGDVAGK